MTIALAGVKPIVTIAANKAAVVAEQMNLFITWTPLNARPIEDNAPQMMWDKQALHGEISQTTRVGHALLQQLPIATLSSLSAA